MSLLDDTLELVEQKERARFHSATAVIVDTAKARAPVDSGETRNRVRSERESTTGLVWSVDVLSDTKQAYLTEVGTGLFGPEAALILPKVAKALHWIDGGEDVFAKSSKGSGKHKGWFSKAVALWPDALSRRG